LGAQVLEVASQARIGAGQPKIQTQTCLACRQSFVPSNGNRKYCSHNCRLCCAPAVYRFIAPDGRSYVGSRANWRPRQRDGINPSGRKINPRLAEALAQYPAKTWTFELLEQLPGGCSKAIRFRAEQRHIDRLRSWDPAHGFNMDPADCASASPECREAHRRRIIAMNAATMAKWLERRGALTSVRLTDSPKARSYNIIAEVEALARGGRDASATAVAPNSAKPA
jgi:hypothetical protein